MTDLRVRTTEIADRIGDVLDILADTSEKVDNRAVAYAIAQQIRLRLDRALKASRDDIIDAMEGEGVTELGPVAVKYTAVDPTYPCNDRDNWEDATVQQSMTELALRDDTRTYIRLVPAHLELDVAAFTQDVRDKVPAALALWNVVNAKGWRKESHKRRELKVTT